MVRRLIIKFLGIDRQLARLETLEVENYNLRRKLSEANANNTFAEILNEYLNGEKK